MFGRRQVYLDYSASTPTDPRVVEVMMPYFTEVYGNSASSHSAGRRAEQVVEDARESIAHIFNCKPNEIIFTSGGTESDNLAVRGAAWHAEQTSGKKHLITTPIEHRAVLKTIDQLSEVMGFRKTFLPVQTDGLVDVEVFADAIAEDTSFASIIYANNEVGTVNSIPQLAQIARQRGVLFHTDAVQASGQFTLDVQALNVDMMSLSAHKFYGPKGVGALYLREGLNLIPSQSGGAHENNRRAGTLNTPAIVGMAKALELAYAEQETRIQHMQTLRDQLIAQILERVPQAQLTGHPQQRLYSHASFVFPELDANILVMHLDLKGIATSSASACKTGNPEPSEVLLALGYPREVALGSLRLTVGKDTTQEDIDYAITTIVETVERMYRR